MTQNMDHLSTCCPYTPISLIEILSLSNVFYLLWLFCPSHVDHQLQGLTLFPPLFCAGPIDFLL